VRVESTPLRFETLRHANRSSWDHVWLSAVVATAAALAVSGARIVGLGWDPSRFVVAGDSFVDRMAAPASLAVLPSSAGYDGQFFYRLALDPFTSEKTAFGIELDSPALRQQRILYPLAAWCISGGDPARVAWVLIGLNVAGMGVLGWLGAAWARECGRHALCGLAFPAYPGFVLTLARDLSEIMTACLALAGLYALRRQRALVAAVLLTLAVLTRETALIIVLGVAVVWLWDRVRPTGGAGRGIPQWVLPVFAMPLLCTAAWQVMLNLRWNTFPAAVGADRFGVPFVGVTRFILRAPFGVLQVLELLFVAGCVVTAGLSLNSSAARRHEKVGWVLALVVAVSLSDLVWVEDWAFMRALTELYVLGTIILLDRRNRLAVALAVVAGCLWVTSAVVCIHRI